MPYAGLPPYFTERRIRFTRRYFLASGSTALGLTGIPTGGVRTGGTTIVVQAPICILTSGAAGANRILQVCEQHGQDGDHFAFNDGLGCWDRTHYVSCRIRRNVTGSVLNPTATMYAGVELTSYLTTAPFPVPPASLGGADVAIHLRARLDTGAWELLVDDTNVSSVTLLTGVTAFDPTGAIASIAEIMYTPAQIVAMVDGKVGATVASTFLGLGVGMSHVGSGVFITTGTNAGGAISGMCFYDLLADTIIGI